MAKKGYFSAKNVAWRELPSGYTQVEYIESSGSQYIDVGFKPNNNTRVVMDFQFTSAPSSDHAVIFGARDSANVNSFCVFYIKDGYFRSDYNTTNTNQWAINSTARYIIDKNKGTTSLNGTTQSYSGATFYCSYNMYLFALNGGGYVYFPSNKLRVFSCQIYDNGTLIRDFVPCKNQSGVAGLYDTVSGVFYENAGTGSFLAGNQAHNDVAREAKKVYFADINGIARKAKKAYFGDENGIAREWFSSPVQLGSLTVGSSVFMNVNGVRKEFLVVHQGLPSSWVDKKSEYTDDDDTTHSYDSSCNGTWLLMKDIYENRQWGSNQSQYSSSDIHSYLNNTFINLLDSKIRNIVKQVKIPFRPSYSSSEVRSGSNGLSTKIFLLSAYEVGVSIDKSYVLQDGTTLRFFSGKGNAGRIAYLDGVASPWFLRSLYSNGAYTVCAIWTSGSGYAEGLVNSHGIRPAFILPSNALVDGNFNIVA